MKHTHSFPLTFISKAEIISKEHSENLVWIKLVLIGVVVAGPAPSVHTRRLKTLLPKPVIPVSLLVVAKHRVGLAYS